MEKMGKRASEYKALQKEYAGLAPDYDTRWSFYFDATVRETVARLSLKAGDRILDIGCGTGAVLAALAKKPVTLALSGVDPVPEMLAKARERLPADVVLKDGGAENLPFADDSVDTVVCCSVFHYIRAPEQALAEIRRVLVPGGSLVITDWCADYPAIWLFDKYLSLFNAAHYHAYGVRELEALLARAGFTTVSAERYRIDRWWGMMTIRAGNPESP